MSAPLHLDRVAIVGLGLIGGSLALAMREAGLAREILGIDADPAALGEALARGAVTAAGQDLAAALGGADLVVLATPVGAMEGLLPRLAPLLAPGAVLTDCASTKAEVARWARAHLGDRAEQFVPGHPIAGSESSGIGAARPGLFRGTATILCPLPESEPGALERVEGLWTACGAEVQRMSPEAHDAVLAAVSHLPQLLASGLVHMLIRRPDADLLLRRAGPGFRTSTRLAGSEPGMWRDICLTNRSPLLREIRSFQAELGSLAGMLERGEGRALERFFSEARRRWEILC